MDRAEFEKIADGLNRLGWISTGLVFRPASGAEPGVFVVQELNGACMVFGEGLSSMVGPELRAVLRIPEPDNQDGERVP